MGIVNCLVGTLVIQLWPSQEQYMLLITVLSPSPSVVFFRDRISHDDLVCLGCLAREPWIYLPSPFCSVLGGMCCLSRFLHGCQEAELRSSCLCSHLSSTARVEYQASFGLLSSKFGLPSAGIIGRYRPAFPVQLLLCDSSDENGQCGI